MNKKVRRVRLTKAKVQQLTGVNLDQLGEPEIVTGEFLTLPAGEEAGEGKIIVKREKTFYLANRTDCVGLA